MTIKFFKNRKYLFLLCLFLLAIYFVFLYHLANNRKELSKKRIVLSGKTNLPLISKEELKNYDGGNPNKPIYIGLDGYVYDVTTGKKFYQKGGAYHYLAGKDSTNELKFFGGDIIKRKYPIIAILKK
ncbi:MAG: cytochrome b5 domain-containing protein [Patescibacteria group bacterium]|nr:cytochrome b5 domain-containing protein [Actinomycetota bacterium]MCL5969964.1 cytochrome b5 domain-containing protein [Patescibacteria group bacterium]